MFRPTNFNSAWLQEELFKPWLAAVEKDNHKANTEKISVGMQSFSKIIFKFALLLVK